VSRKGNTAVYANLTKADAARVHAALYGQTINDYVRSLISADLEELGEPPLERLVNERPRKPRPTKGIQHGTITGYGYFRCRCEACTAARRIYYRQWKAAGACTTL
jgi:hypothetical protein